ncbi:hypothetical protein KF840_10350 [bacterium]|nr:hypothetical protein [bacterium]
MNRRTLLTAAAAVAAVIGVGVVVILVRLDGAVRRAIEERGAAVTGTAVRVDGVDIQLVTGRARLRGLTVANPPGFTDPNALSLAEVEIDLDLSSLFSDPLVIDTVRVVDPRVLYQVNAAGTANIDVIRRNLETQRRAARAAADGTPTAERTRRRGAAGGRRLIIHRLELLRGEVTIDGRAAGGTTRSEQLSPFELTAIGVKQGGVAPAEVGRIILVAVARDVALAVAADELERVVGKQVGGFVGDLLKKGGSGAIGQGLGGILDQLFKKQQPPANGDAR